MIEYLFDLNDEVDWVEYSDKGTFARRKLGHIFMPPEFEHQQGPKKGCVILSFALVLFP